MDLQRLTKAEEEIMQLLWECEPCTVSKLIEAMEEPHPPHSTISSIVRILETKGFVDHNTYGRTHEYFSTVDKKSYSKFSIKSLVASYFSGSMNELVSFLVEESDVSLKDLEKINMQFKKQKK
jgi:BlaI family transcriptional regulator, penicillinase repressor